MSSKKDLSELRDPIKCLGVLSPEENQEWKSIAERFSGKTVTIKNGSLQSVGKFHSLTMGFGGYISMTEVQEDKCSPGLLDAFNYYHPRNYIPELGKANFGFISESFDEDPAKTDLLIIPASDCILECGDEVVELPNVGGPCPLLGVCWSGDDEEELVSALFIHIIS
jgi:hypothetical protein